MVLLTVDTDSVKSYVFATSKLRETRGASALLDHLNEVRIPEIIGQSRMIYSGGGTALAQVEDAAEAKALITRIEKLYRLETISAEITGAWLELADPASRFGESVAKLNYRLRAGKDSKAFRHDLITLPIVKGCESCGLHPAARQSEMKDSLICGSCALKRRANRLVRDGKLGSRLDQLLTYARSKGKWLNASVDGSAPKDFNDIGEAASPRGYIGFIYCDGNRMGDLLSCLETRDSFATLSEGLRRTIREVTFDGLIRSSPDLQKNNKLPFEIIFIGGDDMMLAVPADKAMSLVVFLCEEFEKRTASLLDDTGISQHRKHLSLSAAVVLAHASLPVYHVQSIAEELLKSAKRGSQDALANGRGEVGHIDFHVVTASASESPLLTRKAEWLRNDVQLTERPYSAGELDVLMRRISALKRTGFPSSKLQMLYESVFSGSATQAMFMWAFVTGRARRNKELDKDQVLKLFEFFERDSGPLICPWRQSESGRLSTPMVDVTELYDFIDKRD